MKVLITGAGGLIGCEASKFFLAKDAEMTGIDNNMRKYFFGEGGDITGNISFLESLKSKCANLTVDIRNRQAVLGIYREKGPFDLVIHAAPKSSGDVPVEVAVLYHGAAIVTEYAPAGLRQVSTKPASRQHRGAAYVKHAPTVLLCRVPTECAPAHFRIAPRVAQAAAVLPR